MVVQICSRYFLILCASLLVLGACEKQADQSAIEQATEPPAPLVIIEEVAFRSIQPEFEYPATIESIETAAMRPQVAGVVMKRNITPGADVSVGDLLVELDDAEYRAKLAGIEASMAQAEAAAAEASANYARAEELIGKGYVSAKDYDASKATDMSARAKIKQLEAELLKAQLDLDRTHITAPFSGKISAANYAIGDYVSPSSPEPLFNLVQLDPIYAKASVDIKIYENIILRRVDLEGKGEVIPELRLRLRMANGQDYPHEGVFENWDNVAAGSTGTIAGRALFPNPDGLLLPGHNLTITGKTIQAIERITVPQKAVGQDQQGHYVMTVDENNVVQRKNIVVGIRHGFDWTVNQGLGTGDRVITEGLQKVRSGQLVETRMQ